MAERKSSPTGADPEVLRRMSERVDTIVSLSAADSILRTYTLKFQLEQAADKAAYEANAEQVSKVEHLKRVLQRMVDLALAVAKHILMRTTNDLQGRASCRSVEVAVSVPRTPTSPEMFPSSSALDLAEGTEFWFESGAHLSFASTEVLCMALIAHSELRPALQAHMLGNSIVPYLSEALGISRDHEMGYFQEGYKTEHMRMIANLAYENPAIARAVVKDETLLKEILTGTKVDEENPGMVEWAEFAIRNLCETNQEARDTIKRLTPVALSKDTEAVLGGKLDYTITKEGKVKLSKPATAGRS